MGGYNEHHQDGVRLPTRCHCRDIGAAGAEVPRDCRLLPLRPRALHKRWQEVSLNGRMQKIAQNTQAFSGKDPTKVDRSAAYACRQMAKSVVKSGLCKRALVQLSYAIGVAKPLSLFVETYGTEQGALT